MLLPLGVTAAPTKGTILFVPHDNRPISDQQSADVVRRLGYKVLVPPAELLGGREDLGQPNKLWAWTRAQAKNAQAAVLSSDALLYGSLIGSRKHTYTKQEVLNRANGFTLLRQANPDLKLFVFGSIMRTPKSGAAAGFEEPDYYLTYGNDFFRYTELTDLAVNGKLTAEEEREYKTLTRKIPLAYLQDWFDRRAKNFATNHKLLALAKAGTFDYFILGKDDGAPHSQTHLESQQLTKYAGSLSNNKFQIMNGIDEMGLMLLTRAVHTMTNKHPTVFVNFNKSGQIIPAYSDEPLEKSLHNAIIATGARAVSKPQKADLVLAINTNPDGKNGEANSLADNNGSPRAGTEQFVALVDSYVKAGYPVGVADIAFANGSDNALMQLLQRHQLLSKLRAYGGWNTATNTIGFLLGEGLLGKNLSAADQKELLLLRYLEDWGYQANIRTTLMQRAELFKHGYIYATMNEHRPSLEAEVTKLLRAFALKHLPPFKGLDTLTVKFPWNRGFEADIQLGK